MSEVSAAPLAAEFDEHVRPLLGELRAHCYRMLGSLADADDAVQEALLRAWRGWAGFAGRGSRRSWLYTIATRCCLDASAARGRRLLPIDLGPKSEETVVDAAPVAEVRWIAPFPDGDLLSAAPDPQARYEQREAVELAFVAALQHLSGNQRAALLLGEVVGLPAAEIAATLGTSVAAVNSALQRARRTITARVPPLSQQRVLRQLGDERLTALVTRFCTALERGDADLLASLLAEDVTWSMPPIASWYGGRTAVMDFASRVPLGCCGSWRHLVVGANGQPAVALYLRPDGVTSYASWSINVLSLCGDRIHDVTSFLGELAGFAAFGLPAALG